MSKVVILLTVAGVAMSSCQVVSDEKHMGNRCVVCIIIIDA